MKLSPPQVAAFQEKVYAHYHQHGRPFPWRDPSNAYQILVSEVMLQQTQAERVVPYYQRWLKEFPTIGKLAVGSLPRVLELWQGLGYNRRALLLKRTAEQVVAEHRGRLPTSEAELVKLPGIGPYTAAAVAAFAGNQPAIVIETNIRSVFIHEFCGDREDVDDRELAPLIAQAIDQDQPRQWYQALMDYGAMLKRSGINPSRRSKHYVRQTPFAGSNRQLRGRIIKQLLDRACSSAELKQAVAAEAVTVRTVVDQLKAEGFIRERRHKLEIANA